MHARLIAGPGNAVPHASVLTTHLFDPMAAAARASHTVTGVLVRAYSECDTCDLIERVKPPASVWLAMRCSATVVLHTTRLCSGDAHSKTWELNKRHCSAATSQCVRSDIRVKNYRQVTSVCYFQYWQLPMGLQCWLAMVVTELAQHQQARRRYVLTSCADALPILVPRNARQYLCQC
eukprot:366122-Chlamydomonas_euryale.AAC.20